MCGIFGLYGGGNLAQRLILALTALNHRGQDACGIAISNGIDFKTHKAFGMVGQALGSVNLDFEGFVGIGHTRYATDGNWESADDLQPFKIITKDGPICIAFNGTITKSKTIQDKLLSSGIGLRSSVDTELIAQLLASNHGAMENKIKHLLTSIEGAYSLVIATKDTLYAVRDRYGFRPLCVGSVENSSFVVSSESSAITTLGGKLEFQVPPNSFVKIDANGFNTTQLPTNITPVPCAFEWVYFSRPDSCLDGNILVHQVRQNIGSALFNEIKSSLDGCKWIVSGVPDSATPMAIGFAEASKGTVKYQEVFTKNRYIQRTFIQPTKELRETAVRSKFNPLTQNIKNQNILLIDDSIVRGTTIKQLVRILKENGAAKVFILVGCPPIKHPCHMGVNMRNQTQFISNNLNPQQLATKLNADKVHFLSQKNLEKCLPTNGNCTACWTGKYPCDTDW